MKGKKRVAILGSGFAGFSALRRLDPRYYDILMISPRNYFLFTPLLPSTTVGTIEFRSIIESVRRRSPAAVSYQAQCRKVIPTKHQIVCKGAGGGAEFRLSYDYLLICVGSTTNMYGIPGVRKHALFLKELSDARSIRTRIIENFEQASQPGLAESERKRLLQFVVVGGGPTGVEFAAELHDFLRDDLRKWYRDLLPSVRILLLEAGPTILNSFDVALRGYTVRLFQRLHIEVRTESPVASVNARHLVLANGTTVPYGLIVWSAGITMTEFVRSLPFQKDGEDRILTDAFLRVKNHPSIYAMGDCMTIDGRPFPSTAQTAQQEGEYVARGLNRMAQGKPVKPFRYRHYGMLAYVGEGRALADLQALKVTGIAAWLFWRSAYVTKLVSLKNKILVLFDWWKTRIFGRDISKF